MEHHKRRNHRTQQNLLPVDDFSECHAALQFLRRLKATPDAWVKPCKRHRVGAWELERNGYTVGRGEGDARTYRLRPRSIKDDAIAAFLEADDDGLNAIDKADARQLCRYIERRESYLRLTDKSALVVAKVLGWGDCIGRLHNAIKAAALLAHLQIDRLDDDPSAIHLSLTGKA